MLPAAVAGFNGNGLIVTDNESDTIPVPQLFIPFTVIFAVPEKAEFHVTLAVVVVPVILPAELGYKLHEYDVE